MTTAGPSRPQPHQHRHHPYAKTSSASAPAPAPTQSTPASPFTSSATRQQSHGLPPSPPRSRRDASETPSIGIGLGAAFGGSAGGKWWDEELPPPPASLTAILDSFRKSGEGDRELLLSILGAKKAEEERLTALIQTRLTILQARLSLHTAATAAAFPTPLSPFQSSVVVPLVPPPAAHEFPHGQHDFHPRLPPMHSGTEDERTPSLSSSRSGPGSVSSEIASPPLLAPPTGYMHPPSAPGFGTGTEEQSECPRVGEKRDKLSYWQLPAPRQIVDGSPDRRSLPPILTSEDRRALYPDSRRGGDGRSNGSMSPTEVEPRQQQQEQQGRRDRSGSGLEMLLDAGMRVDSGEC